jgi:choice-of-anchor C domain-containing protein
MFLRWTSRARKITRERATSWKPRLEVLENRCVPSNLVVNGSFETGPDTGPSFVRLAPGSTAITGWTVTRAPIDYCAPASIGPSDGVRSIDLDGNDGDAGGIAQTLVTTPGVTYLVTFDMAGNPNNPAPIKLMRVSAAGQSADFSFDITGRDKFNMGWTAKSWQFTAVGSSTSLEFQSLDPPDVAGRGPAIDNVVVSTAPDLVATSLTWNTAQGGVDFSYSVTGADLTQNTTAALYWASGPTFADRIGGPVYDTQIEHPQGDHGPFYVPTSVLGILPAGATYLLLVVDAPATTTNGVVAESDEMNNVVVRPMWQTKDASVRVPSFVESRLNTIAAAYYRRTREILIITDGERTPAEQALRMWEQLIQRHGEPNVRHLYKRQDLLPDIIAAFNSHQSKEDQLAAMTAVIESQVADGEFISLHLAGKAIDIGSTGVNRAAFEHALHSVTGVRSLHETSGGAHFHLQFA